MAGRKFNKYDIVDDIVTVFDDKGNSFIVDLAILPLIKPYYFTFDKDNYVYARKRTKGKTQRILLHRLITDCPNDKVVDHINHNKSDNRKSNLRVCTKGENNLNRKCNGYYFTRGLWKAYIELNGTRIWLGSFTSQLEAIEARKSAEQIYFKEFAYNE